MQGKNLTLKADLFSFGTILWELATEEIPHFNVRDDLSALADAITQQGLKPRFSGLLSFLHMLSSTCVWLRQIIRQDYFAICSPFPNFNWGLVYCPM